MLFRSENEKEIELQNSAKLKESDTEVVLSNTVTAVVRKEIQWITKSGKGTLAEQSYIDWTIKVNKHCSDIAGWKITDTISTGLKLVEDSVYLEKENGDKVNLSKGEIQDLNSYRLESDILEYQFPSDAEAMPYTLTFRTEVSEDIFESYNTKNYTNTATFGNEAIKYAAEAKGIGLSYDLISKAGSYNPSDHCITWFISINGSKLKLKDVVVTDTIPEGLTYVAGSAKYYNEKVTSTTPQSIEATFIEGNDSSVFSVEQSDDLCIFELKPDEEITEQYTISFKTQVNEPGVYATNQAGVKTYENVVILDARRNGVPLPAARTSCSVTPRSQVIAKEAKGYNYSTQEITWQVTINQNNMPINDAEIIEIGRAHV